MPSLLHSYLRMGRNAFAEQTLLRVLGNLVTAGDTMSWSSASSSPLSSCPPSLLLVQTLHFLAVTLELSGNLDKIKYSEALHTTALHTAEQLDLSVMNVKLWRDRAKLGLELLLQKKIIQITEFLEQEKLDKNVEEEEEKARTSTMQQGAVYNEDELQRILHDAVLALSTPLELSDGSVLLPFKEAGKEADSKEAGSKEAGSKEAGKEEMTKSDVAEKKVRELQPIIATMLKQCEWKEACEQQCQMVRLTAESESGCDEVTADALDLLGLIHESMLEWRKASIIHRHALGIRISTLGSTHTNTIHSMARLGACLDQVDEAKGKTECLLLAANYLHEKYVWIGMNKNLHTRASGLRLRSDLSTMYMRRGEHEKAAKAKIFSS